MFYFCSISLHFAFLFVFSAPIEISLIAQSVAAENKRVPITQSDGFYLRKKQKQRENIVYIAFDTNSLLCILTIND